MNGESTHLVAVLRATDPICQREKIAALMLIEADSILIVFTHRAGAGRPSGIDADDNRRAIPREEFGAVGLLADADDCAIIHGYFAADGFAIQQDFFARIDHCQADVSGVAGGINLGEAQARAADCTHGDFGAAASDGRADVDDGARSGGFIRQMNLGVLGGFTDFDALGDGWIAAEG